MENENLQGPGEDVLQPVSVTTAQVPQTQLPEIEVPAGHVLVVALLPDGSEREGSEFFYPEKSYQRFYGDETKFRIKKKAN